jgi:integrase
MERLGHAPGTQGTYTRILEQAGAFGTPGLSLDEEIDPEALATWAVAHAQERPIGTVLPLRAAVGHYLRAVVGMSKGDVDEILPAAQGRSARMRTPLGRLELDRFYRDVARLQTDMDTPRFGRTHRSPVPVILQLLPRTGLRITECCTLAPGDVTVSTGLRVLRVRGENAKGGTERLVPLNRAAQVLLDDWAERPNPRAGSDTWLFPGGGGDHIGAENVREACRKLRADNPALGKLTPHVLRHTWATGALRSLVSLPSVQRILGHKNIETTAIYLHTDMDELSEAMEKAEDWR